MANKANKRYMGSSFRKMLAETHNCKDVRQRLALLGRAAFNGDDSIIAISLSRNHSGRLFRLAKLGRHCAGSSQEALIRMPSLIDGLNK